MNASVDLIFFTSTRADFGLLKSLILECQKDKKINLKILATGSHLDKKKGYTIDEIYSNFDKDIIDEVPISTKMKSDLDMVLGLSSATKIFGKYLESSSIKNLVILGDRFEALACAQAGYILKKTIFHIHGGEVSYGALDESFRHSVTKFSDYHLASTINHKKRIIQLGENPNSVFKVGSLVIENLKNNKITRKKIIEKLGLQKKDRFFLITYHPVTLANEDPYDVASNLIESLSNFEGFKFIITMPNIDQGSDLVRSLFSKLQTKSNQFRVFESLGSENYIAAMLHSEMVIGNSSSGIIESGILNKVAINIGVRQLGRDAGNNVIHSGISVRSINKSIRKALSSNYNKTKFSSPYYARSPASKMKKIIMSKAINPKTIKTFYIKDE